MVKALQILQWVQVEWLVETTLHSGYLRWKSTTFHYFIQIQSYQLVDNGDTGNVYDLI